MNSSNDSLRNLTNFFFCHFCRKVLFQLLYFTPASHKSLLIQTIAWIHVALVLLNASPLCFLYSHQQTWKIKWLTISLPVSHWPLKQSQEHHSQQLSAARFVFKAPDKATFDSSSRPTCQGNKHQVSELPEKSSDERPLTMNTFNSVWTPAKERK